MDYGKKCGSAAVKLYRSAGKAAARSYIMSNLMIEAQRPESVDFDLQTGAKRIAWEIQMLVDAAGELVGAWKTPITPAVGHQQKMATERVGLHFTNLCLFFCGSRLDAAYLRAEDYGVSIRPDLAAFLLEWRPQIDRALGPVKYVPREEQAVCRQEAARMLAVAHEAFSEFLSLLDPERVTWFVGDEDTCLALAQIDRVLRLLETQEAPEVERSKYYN